jgi:hypothetical protein
MVELGLPILIGLAVGIATLNILIVLFWCYSSRRRRLLVKEREGRLCLRDSEKHAKISVTVAGHPRLPLECRAYPVQTQFHDTTSTLHAAASTSDNKNRWSSLEFPTSPRQAITTIPGIRQSSSTYDINKRASAFAVGFTHPFYAPSPLFEEFHQSEVLARPNKTLAFPACPTAQTRVVPTVDSSLLRGASIRSEDTESTYSAASAPPDLHERFRDSSESLDPTIGKTPTSSSKRVQSWLQVDQIEPLSQERIEDHLIPGKETSRTTDVRESVPNASSDLHHLPSHLQRISLINKELVPETCANVHRKAMLQNGFGELSETARPRAEAEGNSCTLAFNDDRVSPVLKTPAHLAKHRKNSTSVLSLIPQGPLFGSSLENLLAAQDSHLKPPSSHRESRSSRCFPVISTAVPIIPPVSSPFSPPIVNEPVQFSVVTRRAA